MRQCCQLVIVSMELALQLIGLSCRIYFNPMGGKKSVKYPKGPDISADEFPKVSSMQGFSHLDL